MKGFIALGCIALIALALMCAGAASELRNPWFRASFVALATLCVLLAAYMVVVEVIVWVHSRDRERAARDYLQRLRRGEPRE